MNFIIYLLKVSFATAIFWSLYRILLKRLTFFELNRFYLLGSIVLSFLLPLFSFEFFAFRESLAAGVPGIDWHQFEEVILPQIEVANMRKISPLSILPYIYIVVSLLLFVIACVKIIKLLSLGGQRIVDGSGKVKILLNDPGTGSYTLFRRIYLDRRVFEDRLDPVIQHEMVHARQLHSLDLIFMEFAIALLWFNPFVFLFRRYVRENHEFLADSQAQSRSVPLMDYLLCLRAASVGNLAPSVASYFKSSTLKKRIIMLTNNRSKSSRKGLYLLALPVIAVILFAFANPGEKMGIETPSGTAHIPFQIVSETEDLVPSIFPLDKKYLDGVTWDFGEKRIHPFTKKEAVHMGMDIRAPKGTPIYASANGTVIKSGSFEGWGKLVVLKHGEQYSTHYAHMNEIKVEEGALVEKGAVIGTVGTTGKSTGDHLHYEVRKDGENVDPKDYF